MDFQVDRDVFLKAVQRANAVTSNDRRFAAVHLDVDDAGLTVRSTNGVARYSERVSAETKREFCVTYNAARVVSVLGALTAGTVSVTVDEGLTASFKNGRRVFRVAGIPPEEMPECVVSHADCPVLIPSKQLASVIDATKHAMCSEDRPFNGIFVESDGKKLRATTYDDRRFAVATEPVIAPEFRMQPSSSTIPAIREMCGLAEDVGLDSSEGKIRLVAGNVALLITEHGEARMPPLWDQLARTDDAAFRVEDAPLLLETIRSTSVALQTGQPKFDVTMTDDGLLIKAGGGQSDATDVVAVERKRDTPFDVRIDPKFLTDALKQTGCCDVATLMDRVVVLKRDDGLVCGISTIDRAALG